MSKVNTILDRFKEPSSYAALTGVLAMVGVIIPNELWQSITMIGCGICGAIGFFAKEKAK